MIFIKKIAILFFDIIDKFIHQRRILVNLKKINIKINIFVDVGAHKGSYTDLIINNFDAKKIFMYEPQKNIFKFIKKKYKEKKFIKISNSAVSKSERTQKIFINKHDLTSSLTKLNKKNVYLNFKAKLFGGGINEMITNSYEVKTIKLFDLINRNKITAIDLLKIDTEGHELEVLKGLKSKINKVKIILIEFHNDNIYIDYNSKKIHQYLVKNHFYLQSKIKFPFTEWEDRIYLKI
jgi:FkbM family methyltransferase